MAITDVNTTFASNTASGTVYAMTGTGTFTMTRKFADIPLETTSTGDISSRDTSTAIQINIPATSINALMGTLNTDGLLALYNSETGIFSDGGNISSDTLTINGTNLAGWLTSSTQIINTGKYSKLYSGFKSFVTSYFGLAGNFASLYDNSGRLSFTDGTYTSTDTIPTGGEVGDLTPDGLFKIMTAALPATTTAGGGGGTQTAMSGSITISNISRLLRFAVDTNVFNNRAPVAASGAVAEVNYGVGNGFVAGDLIYIASGAQATLSIGLAEESDPNPRNVIKQMTSSTSTTIGPVTSTTESALGSPTVLTRSFTAPILLRITA